jgi:hypothetical protein
MLVLVRSSVCGIKHERMVLRCDMAGAQGMSHIHIHMHMGPWGRADERRWVTLKSKRFKGYIARVNNLETTSLCSSHKALGRD